ncbi:4-hydroxythreonine-4-phosphate dehydrogenase PdxA [Aurantiacibacter sediminis]|uniref:4-hydroxythreonine-4-phosphate dehydrogenase PdxA n=1 Tax=Aurantiacibacter sediminis TaxID=2793064 RepID=A0ABS0N5T2_9SPHN|nr:4-hydroxythreonine-4-phosphate dehydrogenase PdxA [Aurantiacibacter sediminis]MBH5323140.1 4-hydroxythreonine-4-phosphate dehydrogenase PdxA [Aurantiacibacter sediminis]
MPRPLAVTIGDPAGVGPEIIGAASARANELGLPPFRVIGEKDAECQAGSPTAHTARIALDALQEATRLVQSGECSGLVTGPIAKSAIAALQPDFIGQTEFFADACDLSHDASVMMLAGPSLRTVPMTVHCALSEVPGLLSQDLIMERTRIVARAMHTDFGIEAPRIAIAGLNPHAGEDGRMGREEIDIIAPAIAQLRGEGIDASGPHPADTLFAPHKRGSYDVAIAMYHDQALVPLKALDFDEGVNVTLGLPIVRTSPDHGTAFDIAGKGIARPDAMIAAIRMAGEIAERRANG